MENIITEQVNNSPLRKFSRVESGQKRSYGVFLCSDCKAEFESRIERISKMTGRCRCCSDVAAGRKRRTHGKNNKNSRIHVTWSNMKRRCIRPVGKEIEIYKGISVCEDWLRFEPFMKWAIEAGYDKRKTIDRINPLLGYSPENCRFSNYSVQAANRRVTKKNKSGYIGVHFDSNAWRAKITWKGRQIHLGRFEIKEHAALARDQYIAKHNLPHMPSGLQPAEFLADALELQRQRETA